ncbi:helix-turn-helix domain-containing protein [Nitrospirillum amazonense]|uniref:helix-turn-helix domain-containing protein n=1 Tax=Nitrospirillum amazonense TaxID=28077 RepID=UPI002412BF92|nr:helix-turn-helix transcriptional regulator [Nitrospirillum amazonense]MDG3444491.1 helix-turn-helix transcriptional regulator [Nitrospirillum amazonense]
MAPPLKPKSPFAERLIEARGDMKRIDAAQALNLTPGRLGSYEQGTAEPSINTLAAISSLYRISIQWLITGEGEMRPTVAAQGMPASQEPAPALDVEMLRSAIASVRRFAQEEAWVDKASPEVWAEMVAEAYRFQVTTSEGEKRRMVAEEKAKTDRMAG